jgi:hypothetical protein
MKLLLTMLMRELYGLEVYTSQAVVAHLGSVFQATVLPVIKGTNTDL